MRERLAMKVDFPFLVMDEDRHGNERYYVRRKGLPKIRIKAIPGTGEFQHLYDEAIAETGDLTLRRVAPGSLANLINAYLASTDFAELAKGTQATRKRILLNLSEKAGDKLASAMREARIYSWMDDKASTPEAANNLLKALRGLYKFGTKRKIVKFNPTKSMIRVATFTEGYHTWTVDEVKQYLTRHKSGTKARMAMTIALFTGLRRENVAQLGRQHIDKEGRIVIRAVKGRRKKIKEITLPILPPLKAEIALLPKGQMNFLQTDYGKPFSVQGLGNKFKTWCIEADLEHCSIHGLRKAGATIAANNGASDRQLMAMYGWSDPEQANTYTEKRDQALLAGAAGEFLKIKES